MIRLSPVARSVLNNTNFFTGCAGVIVGHPLDTVKVNLQTQNSKNPRYKGTFHCISSIFRHEGVRGLYRGMSSPLAGVAGINAIVFGVYGSTRRCMDDPDTLTSHFVGGCVSGLFQSVFTGPMELAKTRMQLSGKYNSLIDCVRTIYAREGAKGIFSGTGATMLRDVPGFGAYFLTYEFFTRSDGPVSTGRMLLAGGFAGVVSWVVVYPVDVLKSRMQAEGAGKYKNILDCLRIGVKAEGYAFLTRGIAPTVVRAFPTNAACFTVVTWSMRLLDGESVFWERCNDAICNLKSAEVTPA